MVKNHIAAFEVRKFCTALTNKEPLVTAHDHFGTKFARECRLIAVKFPIVGEVAGSARSSCAFSVRRAMKHRAFATVAFPDSTVKFTGFILRCKYI